MSHDQGFHLFDVYFAFKEKPYLFKDALHLNGEGAAILLTSVSIVTQVQFWIKRSKPSSSVLGQTSTAIEKTNYNNFRRATFEAMRPDLDDQRLERLNVNSDAAQGFELLESKILESCQRHIPKKHSSINNPSRINNDVKQSIAMMKERGTTLSKPVLNTSLLDGSLRESETSQTIQYNTFY